MNIAIIGTGNVAHILSRLCAERGHRIVHIAGRNLDYASQLAGNYGATYSSTGRIYDVHADIYIIAVSDTGINDVVKEIAGKDKLTVHTAGSVSKELLSGITSRYGVLYPLQSLKKDMERIPAIPFLIDGNTEEVVSTITELAYTLSPDVKYCNDEDRIKLHSAAVVVSNFTNHLYTLAEDFCIKENLDFNYLKPLIAETANRIMNGSPSALQTGPALRRDIGTLDKHLKLLAGYPKLRAMYLKFTDSIMN